MAFVVEPMANSVCASTAAGFPDLPHAVALAEHDLAVVDDGDGETRHSPVLHGLGNSLVEPSQRGGLRRGRSDSQHRDCQNACGVKDSSWHCYPLPAS